MQKWYYSEKQARISRHLSERPSKCEVFWQGEWREYSEWRSSGGPSNWDDAIVVGASIKTLPIRIDGIEQNFR